MDSVNRGELTGVSASDVSLIQELYPPPAGMNVSAVFIRRPIATTLLTIGLALAGMLAFRLLPVSAFFEQV